MADLTAWLDELDAAHKAASVIGILSDPEHQQRIEAQRAVIRALPKLTAALRAVLTLAEEWDVYVAARAERGAPATGSYDDGVNRAQANAANRIRAAVAAATQEPVPGKGRP